MCDSQDTRAEEPAQVPREQLVRLEEEVDHLKQAVTSHATVDQAIGVILAVGQLTPAHGWDVLKEVSQNTNIKLRHIAELIVTWGRTGELPSEVRSQLESSIDRRSGPSAEDGAAS
ncbi:ANTAR domain-containing protein [Streptomyces sp. p1417]|uniref:ANTAR domain-containing protein n=1 Tax=Streptomyces typhae TaxID=2681492 RepID=A0A6L6X4S1_9ACTN|nr:ANTAR domain-containing protein [Streptomyces typhae]